MIDFTIEFRIVHPLLYMNIIYTNSYIIRLINFSIPVDVRIYIKLYEQRK